ncbi:phosphate-starvation-inducible PsiE family protein [Thiofaba sp. EF100]|jgi:phosphate starvation-inducible membrane PsiE|uniref:phosphate-starvation-inducible protein PsiE n=1 Tax=Thiofaba sp. EF100 TaxID=3121274 RepID=UPI003221FA72
MAESGTRIHNSRVVDRVGNFITSFLHNLMLFAIAVATVWSAFGEFGHIFMGEAAPTLKDILLLFIYLEVLAMVGIYFRTHRLPVRFLVYIAITALTRVLVVDMKAMSMEEILVYSGSILILTAAVLALKFGSARYPSQPPIE